MYFLSKKEYDLLDLLLSKADKVFTREEILKKLWGSNERVNDRIIDVHIRKLHEKVNIKEKRCNASIVNL